MSETIALLQDSGYAVDQAGGQDVTVDLFRQLPTQRYEIVILRAHAGISRRIDSETGVAGETDYVSFSSG